MNTFFQYLFQSTLSLAILLVVYRLFFANQTHLKLNRLILLMIVGFSVLAPIFANAVFFFISPQIIANPVGGIVTTLLSVNLSELVVAAEAAEKGLLLQQIFIWLYAAISSFLLLRLAFNIAKIIRLYMKSEKQTHLGKKFAILPPGFSSFSFFGLLFIDKVQLSSKSDTAQIFKHELVHIEQKHSIDVLLTEILITFQWFNPFAHWLKNLVVENNEFLADKGTLNENIDISDYKILLLNYSLTKHTYVLTNNFSYSLTKKRFKMMEKKKSILRLIAGLLVLPLAFAVVFVACSDPLTEEPQTELEKKGVTIKEVQPGEKIETNGQFDTLGIYTVVEEMPEFQGGTQALYSYLGSNIKYPETAKKEGISGRVFVQFVVEKDGSINNVKILRGIGGGCDEEATRVVKAMPNWKPGKQDGKQVRVKYNLPIKFALQ